MSSFDRIKSFWRTSSDIIQQSILDKTQNFIASSFRRSSIPTPTIQQFDDYLSSLPYIKKPKKSKQGIISSLKPQLVKKCYENVPKQYFNQHYQIDYLIFQKKTKANLGKQSAMQEQLDQVQVCLFNQISSRFDQILSVLRTIQALDLLVVQSQKKIKEIREDNLSKVIAVSEKQNKLSTLIRRKKNLQQLTQLTQKLKQYKKFKQLQEQFQSCQASQQFYTIIPQIKTNSQIYKKLKSTKNAILFIDQAQNNLKRSFAQKINQKIFQYLKKDIPYQIQFWKKNINRNNIMQDRDQDSRNTTGLLDQSAIIVQQDNITVIAKKQQNIQNSVIQYIKKGWQDGQYSVAKFKSDIDALLKSKHNAFMLDFRNFCDQICKKHDRHIENPSLTNLLHQISITFCITVYNYFFDIHKSIILRYFSTNQKLLQFILQLSNNNLSIIQKQKMKIMADGFVSSGSFIIRIIIQKLIDIIDTKVIHEGIDISEIKQIIAVMQNAQIFLQKHIDNVISITHTNTQDTFLSEFFKQLKQKYPIQLLQVAKKRKLMDYLNKMHKNSLTVQLKQSLENQIWQPTDIPTFYYDSLHYLITGQSLNLRRNKHNLKNQQSSMMFETSVLMDNQSQSFFQQPTKLVGNFRIIRNDIIINGQTYKVTQTLLLVLQMLQDYMTLAQNFPVLKGQIGIRINQIIRSYNMSSCQLIVHAGAVALQKLKTKNITSKHLALSSLSLKFILYIMQCLQKRVQILDYTKLKQSIEQHIDIIIKKLNQILVYKANSSKPDINLKSTPSKGTESIVSSTKILLQILSDYYGKQSLNRIFTKQVFNIYIDAISIIKVHTRIQAQALKDDVEFFFGELKALQALDNSYEERRLHTEDLVRRAFEEL